MKRERPKRLKLEIEPITNLFGDAPAPALQAGDWRHVSKIEGLRFEAYLRWEHAADGRPICQTLVIKAKPGAEITARALHKIPFGQLATDTGVLLSGSTGVVGITRPTIGRPGPSGWPRVHYSDLATNYMGAREVAPTAPTKYLAEQYGVSAATMRSWLQECRRLKLLPGWTGRPGRPKTGGGKRPNSTKGGRPYG